MISFAEVATDTTDADPLELAFAASRLNSVNQQQSNADAPLIYDRRGTIAVLTLNRPERLNAVSLALYQALEKALLAIADDASIRSVVLTGAGRAFCVGADLKAHGSHDLSEDERREYVEAGQGVSSLIQNCDKPFVAAVNGHAIGAGLELALACDLLVVADEAKLRFPEISLGTFVGGGAIYTLAARVGLTKAKELIMLGEFFNGAEAVSFGLANWAVPDAEVLPTSLNIAERLSKMAPVSLRHAKRLLNRARHLESDAALELEAEALLACMRTRDWKSGVQAFAEKREPHFTGE